MHYLITLFFGFLLSTGMLSGEIIVHNKILAKVGETPITVLDVKKKLDMLFYQHYSEYLDYQEMRYNFYQAQWKQIFFDLFHRELVMLDALERNFTASSGDIRQEMEVVFGPDMVMNLYRANIAYDEAWNMLERDMIIRRMLYYQVHMRIESKITPEAVRDAYNQFIEEKKKDTVFVFRPVSIQAEDNEKVTAIAEELQYKLIEKPEITHQYVHDVVQLYKEKYPDMVFTLGDSYEQQKSHLDFQVFEMLNTMEAPGISLVIEQRARKAGTFLRRIYFLEKKKEPPLPKLSSMEDQIRKMMVDEVQNEETEAYFKRIAEHFAVCLDGIKESIEQYTPFELQ